MPRTRIKICGITDADTAEVAAEAGADAVGLVFVEASPRSLTLSKAGSIVEALPPFVEPMGLFVDRTPREVIEICRKVGLRSVQLHGEETPGDLAALHGAGLRVVKALAFRGSEYVSLMRVWMGVGLAGVLWDAPPAGPGGSTGGGGRAFSWSDLASWSRGSHLPRAIVAGGLTPENVGEAIRVVRPYAVDVSSGVERSRGVKDAALIRMFCEAVREADAQVDAEARRERRG